MKNRGFTRTISILLAVLTLFSAVSFSGSAAVDGSLLYPGFSVKSDTTYSIVTSVKERHFVIDNETKTNQIKCYALEVDINNPDVSIIASYNDGDADGWGRAKVLDQAAVMQEKLGVNVVGAINGDFFNTSTGEPSGLLVMGGELGHSANGHNYFAVLNDGTAVIRSSSVSTADVREGIGGGDILVKNGAIAITNHNYLAPRSAVGIKADGSVVLFTADGRQAPDSCGMDNVELAHAMLALGCVDALGLDGGGSATFCTKRAAGKSIETRNYPSYMGVNRPVATALLVVSSAEKTGVYDHAEFSQDTYHCHPSSWVMLDVFGVDGAGYEANLPDGEIVVSNPEYGRLVGSMFYGKGKQGTVTVEYIVDGEAVGSAEIEISSDNLKAGKAMLRSVVQFFVNIINTIKTVFEKLKSGTSNRF